MRDEIGALLPAVSQSSEGSLGLWCISRVVATRLDTFPSIDFVFLDDSQLFEKLSPGGRADDVSAPWGALPRWLDEP